MIFPACISREKINAAIWLTNAHVLKERLCKDHPEEMKDIGFYRVVGDDDIEVISFCDMDEDQFVAMTAKDFNNILDATLPKPKSKK